MENTKRFTFTVIHPGDHGIRMDGYRKIVHVTVESSDICGEDKAFEDHIISSLCEWFDGAVAGIIKTT